MSVYDGVCRRLRLVGMCWHVGHSVYVFDSACMFVSGGPPRSFTLMAGGQKQTRQHKGPSVPTSPNGSSQHPMYR